MVIIGFSDKTSKLGVRMICRHFKHCVIITGKNNRFVLHQFVRKNHVVRIAVSNRSVAQLRTHDWVFVYLKRRCVLDFDVHAATCVNYVKHAIGLKNFWIQTPDSLYRYLIKNLT